MHNAARCKYKIQIIEQKQIAFLFTVCKQLIYRACMNAYSFQIENP